MADENPTGRASSEPGSPAANLRTESTVLTLLLDEFPAQLTMDELVLVLHADPDNGDPSNVARRAVNELVGAGLVNRHGRFLSPTRAALYYWRLPML
jgi:hypothetical protein